MDDSLNIAASGLEAAGALLSVAAENLVNENTPGYQEEMVDLVDVADDGMGDGVELAQIVDLPAAGHGGQSTVDPVAQAINFRRAQNLYTANAEVIQASQQMYGNLLNMLDTEQSEAPQPFADDVL